MAYVFALNAARDASIEEFKGKGDQGCVFAAEDSGGLVGVGGAVGEQVFLEVVFGSG